MYLYLGQETVVNTSELVGIFDIETTSVSRTTRAFLAKEQKRERIVEVSAELPKSFVLCEKDGNIAVYLSQISPATLRKRSSFVQNISNMKPSRNQGRQP